MANYPSIVVVDTNVPITANLATDPDRITDDLLDCVLGCVEAIEHVIKSGRLALDDEDEIFEEYRRYLELSGQPGIGDKFMKWLHDNRWTFPEEDRVTLNRNNDDYPDFPANPDLANFDPSDRKFVAVAVAHGKNPWIIQGTDSKWWGWKEGLTESGVTVHFTCENYVKKVFEGKIKA